MATNDLPALLSRGTRSIQAQDKAVERELAKAYQAAYTDAETEFRKFYAALDPSAENKLVEAQKYQRLVKLMASLSLQYTKLTNSSINKTLTQAAINYVSGFFHVSWAIQQSLGVKLAFGVLPVDAIRASVYSEASGKSVITTFKDNKAKAIQAVRATITRGLAAGLSLEKMAASLKDNFNSGYNDAIRVLRTETTRNYSEGKNAAQSRAEDLGINSEKIWVATLDASTRPEHAQLDGQAADENGLWHVAGMETAGPGLFGDPAQDINCFTESMRPVTVGAQRLFKRPYSGRLYRIHTALGNYIEATPNHPILTNKGWISASQINKGTNIVNVNARKFQGWAGKIKNGPATFAEVSDFSRIVRTSNRIADRIEQFHGDGSNREIEVKTFDRCLPTEDEAAFNALIEDKIFSSPYILQGSAATNGSNNELGRAPAPASHGIVCTLGELLSVLGGSLGHPEIHRSAATASADSVRVKNTAYNGPADPELFSQLFNGEAGIIELDQVTFVDAIDFSGHVYNLQTESGLYGLYSSNGNIAIVHNCRCSTSLQIVDVPAKYRRENVGPKDVVDNQSYAEWYKSQGGPDKVKQALQ